MHERTLVRTYARMHTLTRTHLERGVGVEVTVDVVRLDLVWLLPMGSIMVTGLLFRV